MLAKNSLFSASKTLIHTVSSGVYHCPHNFFKRSLSIGEKENISKLTMIYKEALKSMQPDEKVAKGTHFELYPGEANKATSIIREQFDDSSGFLRIKYKKTTNGLRAYYHNLPPKHQGMLKILRAGMPQSIGCPDLGIPGDIHEGIYLELAVALASETFGSVILIVDDYIQRFTYQLYDTMLSSVAAKNMAIKEGKKWIERNKPIIGKFENVEALLTWADYTSTPEYQKRVFEVQKLYETNEVVRIGIDNAVEDFLTRFEKRRGAPLGASERQRGKDLVLTYLIEECGLIRLLSRSPSSNYGPHISPNNLEVSNEEVEINSNTKSPG